MEMENFKQCFPFFFLMIFLFLPLLSRSYLYECTSSRRSCFISMNGTKLWSRRCFSCGCLETRFESTIGPDRPEFHSLCSVNTCCNGHCLPRRTPIRSPTRTTIRTPQRTPVQSTNMSLHSFYRANIWRF